MTRLAGTLEAGVPAYARTVLLLRRPLVLAVALPLVLAASFLRQLHLASGTVGSVVPDYLWLLCLGLVGGALLAFGPRQLVGPLPWIAGSCDDLVARRQYGLAGAAVLCSLFGAWLVHANGSPTIATLAWVLGLALILAAATDAETLAFVERARLQWRRLLPAAAILLAILAIAAALRIPDLAGIPGYVHNDEASNGLTARNVANGFYPTLFTNGWASLPLLGYSWDALFFKLFGDSLTSFRLSSAVLGLGSVAITMLLGRELFGLRAGLLAAALLTVFHMHIHFSRVGHHYIQALFAVTLTTYLVVLALRYGTRLAAVGAGIMLSVDIQVYYAARVAYVIVPVVIVYVLLVGDRTLWRRRLSTIAWLALGWLVGVAPIGAFITGDWSDFTARTRDVLALGGTSTAQDHVFGSYGTHDALAILRTQLWRIVQTFNFMGDTSEQYGIHQPMLDPISAALFPTAVAYALFRLKRPGFGICLIALASILVVGGVVTIDPPFWPRLIVIVPILALLIAALLDGLWQLADRLVAVPWPALVGGLMLLAAIAFGNHKWYFDEYAPAVHASFLAAPMDIGNYLRPIHDAPVVYMLTDGGLYLTHEAVHLLAPQVTGCNITEGVSTQGCPSVLERDRIFFVAPGRADLISMLEKTYPRGTLRVLRTYDTGARIYVYRIQR